MKKITLIIVAVLFSAVVMAQDCVIEKGTENTNVSVPAFTGLQEYNSIDDFLSDYIYYPDPALKFLAEGTVVVRFNVEASGELSDLEVINSVFPDCDAVVLEALQASQGMWVPGTINGKPAKMEEETSVVFILDGSVMYQSARDYTTKGSEMLEAEKYKRAIRLFSKAIVIAPNSIQTLYQRGVALYYSGDTEGAWKDFNRLGELGFNIEDNFIAHLDKENM